MGAVSSDAPDYFKPLLDGGVRCTCSQQSIFKT